jgi:hypothetical protein
VLRKSIIVLVLAAAVLYFFLVSDPDAGTGIVLWDPAAEEAQDSGEPLPQEIKVSDQVLDDAAAAREAEGNRKRDHLPIHGRVTRIDGSPVAGVAVRQEHPYLRSNTATSDADGAFELLVEEARGELVTAEGPWLLLGGERYLMEGHADGYSVIVAQARPIAGRVTDQSGAPLRGVNVSVVAPSDLLVPLGIVAPPVKDPRQTTRSDASGAFHIDAAPMLDGVHIEAALSGYRTVDEPLATTPGPDLVLVMVASH